MKLLPDDYLESRIKNIPNKVESTKEFIKNYDGTYIVAKDDENVLGIMCYSNPREEKYSGYGHIGALYF